jgi:hypothetical protein
VIASNCRGQRPEGPVGNSRIPAPGPGFRWKIVAIIIVFTETSTILMAAQGDVKPCGLAIKNLSADGGKFAMLLRSLAAEYPVNTYKKLLRGQYSE